MEKVAVFQEKKRNANRISGAVGNYHMLHITFSNCETQFAPYPRRAAFQPVLDGGKNFTTGYQ